MVSMAGDFLFRFLAIITGTDKSTEDSIAGSQTGGLLKDIVILSGAGEGSDFMPITNHLAVLNWFRFILGRLQPHGVILDDFDRVDQAPPSSDYYMLEGSAGVVNNQVGGLTTGENLLVYNVIFSEKQEAYLTLTALPGINEGVSLFGRFNTATGNGYDFQIERRAEGALQNELRLFQYDAWNFGALLGSYPWNTWQVGDKFGVKYDGSSIKCFAMAAGTSTWVEIISVTNSAHIQSGKIAFGMFSNNARWDDFGGGDTGLSVFDKLHQP